jgi:hypothetical protein
MSKPGPSKEYRDLLNGRISPDDYVAKLKKEVDRHLHDSMLRSRKRSRGVAREDGRAAAAG